MVKKILSLILSGLLLISLVGCKKPKNTEVDEPLVEAVSAESQMVIAMNPQIAYSSGASYQAFKEISSTLEQDMQTTDAYTLSSKTPWSWISYDDEAEEWISKQNIKVAAWQNLDYENKNEYPYSYTYKDNSNTALTPYISSSVKVSGYEAGSTPKEGVLISVTGKAETGLGFVVTENGDISITDPSQGNISVVQRVDGLETHGLENDECKRAAQVIIYHNGKALWATEFGNPHYFGGSSENDGVYVSAFPKLEKISVNKGDLISIVVKNLSDTRTPLNLIPEEAEKYREASKLETANGSSYITVGGKPYLMYGIQTRLDRAQNTFNVTTDIQFDTYIKPYFEKTKELGFNTIIIPVKWRFVEPVKDEYSSMIIDKYYQYAEEFDLNVQLLWFGSDVCGFSTFAPSYILNDQETYSRHEKYKDVLDLSDMDTVEREIKAFSYLMDYLYKNDTKGRTVAIQIFNEANATASGGPGLDSNTDTESIDDRTWMGGQKKAVLNLMNALGMIVKTGPYRCVTRYNFITYQCYYNGVRDNEVQEVLELSGIDIVGFDSYESFASDKFINKLKLQGNLAHFPEFGAGHQYAVPQVLVSIASGGATLLYQLKACDSDSGYDIFPDKDNKWNYRTGNEYKTKDSAGNPLYEAETAEYKAFNNMLYKIDEKLALCDTDATAVFNQKRQTNVNETAKLGDLTVGFKNSGETNYGGCGFITKVSDNQYLIFATKGNSVFSFSGAGISEASSGYYNAEGKWCKEKSVSISGNTISITNTMVTESAVVLVTLS